VAFAGSDFGRDLLIEASADYERHNLRSRAVMPDSAVANRGSRLVVLERCVTAGGLLDCVQQILVPERFRQNSTAPDFNALTDMGTLHAP